MRTSTAAATLALALFSGVARADDKAAPATTSPDYEITSDTAAQFYEVRSPTGVTLLQRRRLTTTLGVAAYDLLPRPNEAGSHLLPELTFRARLRYDADYGAAAAEADPQQSARFVPGFSRGPIDLMFAYVEGRRFFRGLFGFKIGRQYVADALGWWSFDGGLARLTTPVFVAVEAYGGLEVRGGFPLSPSADRFSAGGVWRGDRSGLDPAMWPSFQPADVAPALGVAVESTGVTWLHSRATYRRVWNTGDSNASQFASGLGAPVSLGGPRVSQERFGYALSASHPKLGGVQAGVTYDLYANRVPTLYASAEGYAGDRVTLGVDYDFYQPAFDGDSIWNFFAAQPTHTIGARGDVQLSERWSASATGFARLLMAAPLPADGPGVDAATVFGGGAGHVRYRSTTTTLGARTNMQFGESGRRAGGDLYGERLWLGRWVASARTGLWEWKDDARPDREATSFQYGLGLGYRFFDRSRAQVEWQHDVNRLVGQRFRLMVFLTLAVLR